MLTKAPWVWWDEARPSRPPTRGRGDWSLAAAVVVAAVLELLLRSDLTWPWAGFGVGLAVALALLWRRTHPAAAVLLAFGTLTVVEVAAWIGGSDPDALWSSAAVLLLPYALLRWGSVREAAVGLGAILGWLTVTHLAHPVEPAEIAAGYAFFLFAAALGASFRLHADGRARGIEEAKLRQRNELARELHDTVGHHVSAIAVQAQAGRTLATSDPEAAAAALEGIEESASRTLEEMRAMLAVLGDGAAALAPQPGAADIAHLARDVGGPPRVVVHLAGGLDGLSAVVGTALYRLAQESVTNATRHARDATEVVVDVVDEGDRVAMTVHDDGTPSAGRGAAAGYGLRSMAERVELLHGTFHAGPVPGRGWSVHAVLPKGAT